MITRSEEKSQPPQATGIEPGTSSALLLDLPGPCTRDISILILIAVIVYLISPTCHGGNWSAIRVFLPPLLCEVISHCLSRSYRCTWLKNELPSCYLVSLLSVMMKFASRNSLFSFWANKCTFRRQQQLRKFSSFFFLLQGGREISAIIVTK